MKSLSKTQLTAGSILLLLIFAAVCGVVTGAYRVNRRENLRLYMLSRCADPHC